MARLRRVLVVLGLVFGVAIVAAGGLLGWRLRASLATLSGTIEAPGLHAVVDVGRDHLGVPVITAEDEVDAAWALGFLHAQERFFQMDLQRRAAAGELSALVGAVAIEEDRQARVHRFRARAQRALAQASAEEQAILAAYAAGANHGRVSAGASPWEYLVLGGDVEPWLPEDSFLVLASMYTTLQGEDHLRELALETARAALPAELVAFLFPPGTEWDAAIDGEPFGPPTMPTPEVVAGLFGRTSRAPVTEAEALLAGSNNFAIAPARTASGLPIVAGDMHLPLGVPTLWYRAQFELGDGRRLVGPTLPGTPGLVSGSNGSIAWAYTNAYGDWTDLVVVEPDGNSGYRTPEGSEPFETVVEKIEVADGKAVELEVRETRWGPIVREEPGGRLLARRWVAYEPAATNLGPTYLARARSVAEALELAPKIGIPAQNLTVVDRDGAIGWTVLSAIPRRRGFDGTVPLSWASGEVGWDGWVGSERPHIVNPAGGQLWTANARVVGGEALAVLGDGGYDLGARAGQIRDGLSRLDQATPADLLAIQLDDRAVFLARWQVLLGDLLASDSGARTEVASAVANWGARASVDSPGYRIVRAFRMEVEKRVYDALTAPCLELDEKFSWRNLSLQREGALWQLVSQRPAHLLPTGFASWEAFLLDALDATTAQLLEENGSLAAANWGARNHVRLRHPLSPAIPLIGRWIDFPARSLPGDWNMPRVQSPGFGASQRMVVSPGREEEGIFHLPGGQGGHPLSPYYRAGLEAWEEGQATQLLAGPIVERLRLEPLR